MNMPTNSSNSLVNLTITDGVAELRLNRPDKLNAISLELMAQLRRQVESIRDYDDVFAVLLTGAGDSFCTGADLEYLDNATLAQREEMRDHRRTTYEILRYARYPVLVGACGNIVGAGANLLSFVSDLRYVSTDAEIWWPEVDHGLLPLQWGVDLADQIGFGPAAELILLGRHLTADEAQRLGLVNRVLPFEEVEETARETAHYLAKQEQEHGNISLLLSSFQAAREERVGTTLAQAHRERIEWDRDNL